MKELPTWQRADHHFGSQTQVVGMQTRIQVNEKLTFALYDLEEEERFRVRPLIDGVNEARMYIRENVHIIGRQGENSTERLELVLCILPESLSVEAIEYQRVPGVARQHVVVLFFDEQRRIGGTLDVALSAFANSTVEH